MPRYFFNIYDRVDNIDGSGTVLDGIYDARLEAVRFAGRFIDMHAATVQFSDEWRLEAVDDRGLLLFRIEVAMSSSPAVRCLYNDETVVEEDRIVGLFQISPSSVSAAARNAARAVSPASAPGDDHRRAAVPDATPSSFERVDPHPA